MPPRTPEDRAREEERLRLAREDPTYWQRYAGDRGGNITTFEPTRGRGYYELPGESEWQGMYDAERGRQAERSRYGHTGWHLNEDPGWTVDRYRRDYVDQYIDRVASRFGVPPGEMSATFRQMLGQRLRAGQRVTEAQLRQWAEGAQSTMRHRAQQAAGTARGGPAQSAAAYGTTGAGGVRAYQGTAAPGVQTVQAQPMQPPRPANPYQQPSAAPAGSRQQQPAQRPATAYGGTTYANPGDVDGAMTSLGFGKKEDELGEAVRRFRR